MTTNDHHLSRKDKAIGKLSDNAVRRIPRPTGMDEGKIWIADDFDGPDPDVEALFDEAPLTTTTPGRRSVRGDVETSP